MLDINITKTETPKAKPAAGQKLGFGKILVILISSMENASFQCAADGGRL